MCSPPPPTLQASSEDTLGKLLCSDYTRIVHMHNHTDHNGICTALGPADFSSSSHHFPLPVCATDCDVPPPAKRQRKHTVMEGTACKLSLFSVTTNPSAEVHKFDQLKEKNSPDHLFVHICIHSINSTERSSLFSPYTACILGRHSW